ncbi:hypothetical protein [Kitasatospora sp. HPMI-4]|uniref:hypothetical protein n=1 Tax=Kitasatospora sp. HPMI-4 TaxID=3448443 RepID=UPI003F1B23E5
MTTDLVYHPAGSDTALRGVLEDLQAGRWKSMRDLLEETGTSWPLRTARTQVLAAVAASSDVLRDWAREEPGSADLAVMQARVAVHRALKAHRARRAEAGLLEDDARRACSRAAQFAPADPVPWICRLALAEMDEHRVWPEHWEPSPVDELLSAGPWRFLIEAHRRDFGSREAYHRMLRFFLSRPSGLLAPASTFASWVASWAPAGSPLVVLPLYCHVERYRRSERKGSQLQKQWAHEPVSTDAARALAGWFDVEASEPRSVPDLSYLAHALWAGGFMEQASQVFDALVPFASRTPWSYVAPQPELAERTLISARQQASIRASATQWR